MVKISKPPLIASIASPRELIIVVDPNARLRVTPKKITAKDANQLEQLKKVLAREKATLIPLFGLSEDLLEYRMSRKPEMFATPALNLSLYYRVITLDERFEPLVEQLRQLEIINSVYIKPGARLTTRPTRPRRRTAAGSESDCDFRSDQQYLDSGEFGINARYAWEIEGGSGEGVKIIDVEGAWCFSHSDLTENLGGLVGGVPVDDQLWRDHGTAVLGLLGGDLNNFGITGICPNANVKAVSIFGFPNPGVAPTWGTEAAIRLATDMLCAGDVLVLELHFPGPVAGFEHNPDQIGYIPAEWWPDCLAGINYAIAHDIIVVASAGNGFSDLDELIYDNDPPPPYGPFPTGWQNPLTRDSIDTGSIFVGAGAPPNGHHGTGLGPGRSRLAFSNYGSMVDAQGWGDQVTTTGFRTLCSANEDYFYTTEFNGTSSAAAIVAGAVACLQGIRKAAGDTPLTSRQVRQILQETGSEQTDFPGPTPRPATQRIGNLPNLKEMIEKLAEF